MQYSLPDDVIYDSVPANISTVDGYLKRCQSIELVCIET